MNHNHQLYLQALLELVDVKAIRTRKFKVLTDPVNGTVCELSVELLERLGCEVVKHNCDLNQLPQRAPEPRAKSLVQTAAKVVTEKCDLGVGFDMDADRVLFIDEIGEVLSEDLSGAILGKAELKRPEDVCVTPLNSSGIFKKVIEAAGGKVAESLVGPPEIIEMIKKKRAVFGYEETGKYFFSRYFIWADGLLASMKMLQILAKTSQTLSQIRLQYPKYFQVKLAFNCAFEKMPKRWVGKGEKMIFSDSWLFIRGSGTEPIIRIFTDSPSLETAKQLAEKGKRIVEKACAG
ncbi:MAG: hypothetical protein V1810_00200 [Candidatus Beckwithbacteria bacterium]